MPIEILCLRNVDFDYIIYVIIVYNIITITLWTTKRFVYVIRMTNIIKSYLNAASGWANMWDDNLKRNYLHLIVIFDIIR
jgi:hypothetical protein